MRSVLTYGVMILGLVVASSPTLAAGPVCTPIDDGQLRCAIAKISDCEAINDYPYARNLFCPAAFSAAQEMVSRLAETLGAKALTNGFFYYYQTMADPEAPPDDQSQTTIACLDTPAPYPSGKSPVVGAGTPLCHLVAYATSPGPVAADRAKKSGNPVPDQLRAFPGFFGKLYAPTPSFPLRQFRTGSVFDSVVEALGAAGRDAFVADYPRFSPTELYDPAKWRHDPRYHGISGGGGGGWGGEIAILGADGEPLTLLAFGGGGGGGMTSSLLPPASPFSVLGAGGGGGVQFGNAYRSGDQHYNGLGLGAGVGSDETSVQYSYNDYAGSGNPPLPVHQYNPAVIDEYQRQLKNLGQQIKTRFKDGKTIVLMGGGGMGAGTEYLMENGQEFTPHALSTQAGFQFSYEFRGRRGPSALGRPTLLADLQAKQDDFYKLLGDDFRVASRQAYQECGQDYSNYACMCPRTHAIVICLAGQQIGDASKIPSWLQQPHCGDDSAPQGDNGLTSYQQLLLGTAGELAAPCTRVLLDYFTSVNSPVNARY